MTTSERHIGELGMRCLSTLNRVQDYRQSLIRRDRPMKTSRCVLRPPLKCGVRYMGRKKYLTLFLVTYIIVYAREKSNDAPSDAINLRVYLEIWVDFPYLCTRKRNERPCGDAGCLTLRDL